MFSPLYKSLYDKSFVEDEFLKICFVLQNIVFVYFVKFFSRITTPNFKEQ